MKLVARMFLALNLVFMLALPTFAYLDPSVMTYTIQAVAGIVIAVGAGIGIYWRKAKKKVNDKLGIDENAKKELEEDIIVYNEKTEK